ncbi:hypothetical protein ANO11243_018210 [Dothideomycetidae sp. 11243]|nr:hypothetical protein ANO11243_018210 [fungal sp. No.11243]
MNEFCKAAYPHRGGIDVPVKEAYVFYVQLVNWYDSLPEPMQARNIVLPTHLQLHQIADVAYKGLHTLVRLYYLRHGYEAMDLFIVKPLMIAAVRTLDDINKQPSVSDLEVLRSTLVLVTSGLYTQRKNFYLAEALYRVTRAKMRPQEAELLKITVDLEDEEDQPQQILLLKQQVRSHWPVSVIKKKEDLDAHILANLVKSLRVEG